MDADFWHERWQNGEIGFHQAAPNALMVAHFPALGLAAGARVFVPLCGKTHDIGWLLGQGYRVVGAELSEDAVKELFAELGVTPTVTTEGPLRRYAAPGLDVLVGDVFDVTAQALGAVDAVFDRAALVALPDGMRADYAAHVIAITQRAVQCVIVFTYDQAAMSGPPFSITDAMVNGYFAGRYTLEKVADVAVPGLAGKVDAVESCWTLK